MSLPGYSPILSGFKKSGPANRRASGAGHIYSLAASAGALTYGGCCYLIPLDSIDRSRFHFFDIESAIMIHRLRSSGPSFLKSFYGPRAFFFHVIGVSTPTLHEGKGVKDEQVDSLC